jgi:AcrR family transcriptional regulator
MARYLRGHRVDVQAIATELGLGRTTIYRWFGSREQLIGEVLAAAAAPLIADARAKAGGDGGPALLDTFDRLNRSLVGAQALRQFVERERAAAVRIITSGTGLAQRIMVERITALIEAEVRAGAYDPPVEPATLAYAIVRLGEAFLFNDAAAGMRGDVERLREVEAALLGVPTSGGGRAPSPDPPGTAPGS